MAVHPNSMSLHSKVLNEKQASQIKTMINNGIKLSVIAKKYNVHETSIRDIRDGRSFIYVTPVIRDDVLKKVRRKRYKIDHDNEYYDKKKRAYKLLGNKCYFCNETENLHLDIINKRENPGVYPSYFMQWKLSRWDDAVKENLRLLCLDCWINFRHLINKADDEYYLIDVNNETQSIAKSISKFNKKKITPHVLHAIDLHRKGYDVKYIANELGVSKTTIYSWFNKIDYRLY